MSVKRALLSMAIMGASLSTTCLSAPVAAQSGQPLPTRGKVVFKGTYKATMTIPGRPLRGRLTINGIARAMGTSREFEGAATMSMEIDGAAIVVQLSGTGGLKTGRLSGLIQGNRCRLADDIGDVWEGTCGPQGFSGTIASVPGAKYPYKGMFTTTVASVEDYAERDRRAAAGQNSQAATTSPAGPKYIFTSRDDAGLDKLIQCLALYRVAADRNQDDNKMKNFFLAMYLIKRSQIDPKIAYIDKEIYNQEVKLRSLSVENFATIGNGCK